MNTEQKELAIEALRAHDDFLRTDYEERAERLNSSLGGLAVDNSPEEIRANHNLLRDFVSELPYYDGQYMCVDNAADLRAVQAHVLWVPQILVSLKEFGSQPYFLLGRNDSRITSELILAKPRIYIPASENEEEKTVPPEVGNMKINRFILDNRLKNYAAIKNEHLTEGEIGKYAFADHEYRYRDEWLGLAVHSMMKRKPTNPDFPKFRKKSAYSDYTLSIFGSHDYARELAGIFRKTSELLELYKGGEAPDQVDSSS